MKRVGPGVLIGAMLLLFAGVATSPVWSQFDRIRLPEKNDDWDNQLLLAETQREAIVHYGVLPLWNNYPEGGTPLLANPESSAAYPLVWLTLPLSSQAAIKVQILLHFAIGLAGMYCFCRGLKLGPLASAYAAVAFMGASIFPERMRTGHLMWMGLAWMPLALIAGMDWSSRNRSFSAVALTLQWLLGAHYLVIYTFSALAVLRYYECVRVSRRVAWSVCLLGIGLLVAGVAPVRVRPWLLLVPLLPPLRWAFRSTVREGRRLAVLLVFFCLLSAVKLLPAIEFWSFSPRFSAVEQVMPPENGMVVSLEKWSGLLARDHVEVHEDQPTFFHPLPLMLALIGACFAWNEARGLLLLFIIGWCWSLGSHSAFNVAGIVESLPVVSALRYCARASILVFFCLSVMAGRGCQVLADKAGRIHLSSWRYAALGALVSMILLSGGWMAVQSRNIYPGTFNGGLESAPKVYRPFVRKRCDSSMYLAFLSNAGCVDGFTAAPLVNARHITALQEPNYRGEAYVSGGLGEVDVVQRTPGRLVIDTKAGDQAGHLILNQSYYPGWSLQNGDEVESWQGLLATPLAAGETRYTFVFRSLTAQVGLALSSLSVLYLIYGARRRAGVGPK